MHEEQLGYTNEHARAGDGRGAALACVPLLPNSLWNASVTAGDLSSVLAAVLEAQPDCGMEMVCPGGDEGEWLPSQNLAWEAVEMQASSVVFVWFLT